MTLTITPADLSAYEAFQMTDDRGNHTTVMVRGELRQWAASSPTYTISLKILGDFGSAEHFWSHAGGEGETWWNWLEGTDQDYFLGKLFGTRVYEFAPDRAHKEICKEILQLRKQTELSKGQAREIWDSWTQYEDRDEHSFFRDLSQLSYTDERGWSSKQVQIFPEYYEYGRKRIKPRLAYFWEHIWRPFITQAKETRGFTLKENAA